MTGNEVSAIGLNLRSVCTTSGCWFVSRPANIPIPVSRIEGDAVIPEDDDPWFDDDEPDEDGLAPEPKRPFWNR